MQKKKSSLIKMSDHDEKINTWEYIDDGIKKTTLKRKFREDDYNDHYISEIIPYEKPK